MLVFIYWPCGLDTNPSRLALSRCWYSFTYSGRSKSLVSLGEKEGHTNIQISAELRIELGTLWSEGRDFTNCTNHARPTVVSWEIFLTPSEKCFPVIKKIEVVIIFLVNKKLESRHNILSEIGKWLNPRMRWLTSSFLICCKESNWKPLVVLRIDVFRKNIMS